MTTRLYRREDEAEVRSLGEQSFDVPDLCAPQHLVSEALLHEGKIIGVGTLRSTAEGILILDPKLSKETRATAVTKLLNRSIYQCQRLGLDEIHVFLAGPHAESFSQVLRKHYGFVDCKGIPLTLRF